MQHSTQVLSEALNKLIKAYEQLQKENANLMDQISGLETDKEKMQQTIDELSSTTTKQGEDISSMLVKIESLLGFDDDITKKNSSITNEVAMHTSSFQATLIEEDFAIVEDEGEQQTTKEEEISTSKIDLQRMEDLLSGFGNNR